MPLLWRKICVYGIPLAMLIGGIIYQVSKSAPPPQKQPPAITEPQPPLLSPPRPETPANDEAQPTSDNEPASQPPAILTTAPDSPAENLDEQPPLTLQLATQSLTSLAAHLSTNPLWLKWLGRSDIILHFVRLLDDVSLGERPLASCDFLRSEHPFSAVRGASGAWVVSPAAAARYDFAADVFCSLDPDAVSRLYPRLEPALQEALSRLGYRDRAFREVLTAACTAILSTPVIAADAPLVSLSQDTSICQWHNPELEALTDAQKLFLRLGARNTARIRAHLQKLAEALELYATEE